MIDPEAAAENLRIIRNLMERATVYRALSAPSALVAAALVFPTALITGMFAEEIPPLGYYVIWVAVLMVVGGFNTLLLWRDARKRNAQMVSSSFVHAIRALLPPLFAGGLISLLLVDQSVVQATLCWVVFYGLAMLATHGFAPASMVRLGGSFLATGLVLWLLVRLEAFEVPGPGGEIVGGCWIMAGTFGLMHLIYGLIVGRWTGFRLNGSRNV